MARPEKFLRCLICRHQIVSPSVRKEICVLCYGAIPSYIATSQAQRFVYAYILKHFDHKLEYTESAHLYYPSFKFVEEMGKIMEK